MLTKGNVTIGLETRFGPNWSGVRCGAKTEAGGECQRPRNMLQLSFQFLLNLMLA